MAKAAVKVAPKPVEHASWSILSFLIERENKKNNSTYKSISAMHMSCP